MTEQKPRERYIYSLIRKPESTGLSEAKFAYTAQIKLAGSSRLRCQYGCLVGENKTMWHPPETPDTEESRELFIEYRFGLMLRREVPFDSKIDEWKTFSDTVLGIEQKAFHEGYPRAFTVAVGTCQYLHYNDRFRPCMYDGKKRPTFEALGVELLETMELLAWHKFVDRTDEEPFQQLALLMLE